MKQTAILYQSQPNGTLRKVLILFRATNLWPRKEMTDKQTVVQFQIGRFKDVIKVTQRYGILLYISSRHSRAGLKSPPSRLTHTPVVQ